MGRGRRQAKRLETAKNDGFSTRIRIIEPDPQKKRAEKSEKLETQKLTVTCDRMSSHSRIDQKALLGAMGLRRDDT